MKVIDNILSDPQACAKYRRQLAAIGSKQQAIDLALSIQGIEYLASAIDRGVVSVSDIRDEFAQFANAAYIFDGIGYTSSLFLESDAACVSTTAALIIDCPRIIVEIPVAELYIVDSPNVLISGFDVAVVHLFGSSIHPSSDINHIIIK